MASNPSRFDKTDTVEKSLSELELQSTNLISYFDSFFSSNFGKDNTIIREDGVVEVLSAQTVTTGQNNETTYYFQSSAERLQVIGELMQQELLDGINLDTSNISDEVKSILSNVLNKTAAANFSGNSLGDFLNANQAALDTLTLNTDNGSDFINMVRDGRGGLLDFLTKDVATDESSVDLTIDTSPIKKFIDDGDNVINAFTGFANNSDGDFEDPFIDNDGDGVYTPGVDTPAEIPPEFPSEYYYIQGKKLDTFERVDGYLVYDDVTKTDSPWYEGPLPIQTQSHKYGTNLDFSDKETLALAMYSILTLGASNDSKNFDRNGDGLVDPGDVSSINTLDDAFQALDNKISDFLYLSKDYYDLPPASREIGGDPDNDIFPPSISLLYINSSGEIDESRGLFGSFNPSDPGITSLADLISLSPDVINDLQSLPLIGGFAADSLLGINYILDNWNDPSITIQYKKPIMQYFVHSELYTNVASGLNTDAGISHPNSLINKFTSDNSSGNPFIGVITSGTPGDDDFREQRFPLLKDFLEWERNGVTQIVDDDGFIFTGPQELGKSFGGTSPNQFQQLLDLFLQHVEANVPRYIEDNRTILDLFATGSLVDLPNQEHGLTNLNLPNAQVEQELYKSIKDKSIDALSASQNYLSRGIYKADSPILLDIFNQTLLRKQEYDSHTDSNPDAGDEINLINSVNDSGDIVSPGSEPEKNGFVANFPPLDIRDFDMYFKAMQNEIILVLNPILLAQGKEPIDTFTDVPVSFDSIYPPSTNPQAHDFLDITDSLGNIDSVKLATLLERYEKLEGILDEIEKPVDSLGNDQGFPKLRIPDPVSGVYTPYANGYTGIGTTLPLDEPRPELIKVMLEKDLAIPELDGIEDDPSTTALVENRANSHDVQIDFFIDLFANNVEFGQPMSYAQIYNSQRTEAANINARQFTKKLAEPRADGSVPQDDTVPAPLLYASSTSLVIGAIGQELIRRVDEMNVSNNIPAFTLQRDANNKLDTADTNFSGSKEAQIFLKNLLEIANSDSVPVNISLDSVSTYVNDINDEFIASPPYRNVSITYVDSGLLKGLKSIRKYLRDKKNVIGSLSGNDDKIFRALNIVNDKINGTFQDDGYIKSSLLDGPEIAFFKDLRNGIIRDPDNSSNTFDYKTDILEVYDKNTEYYFENNADTGLTGNEIQDISKFIHGYGTFLDKFKDDGSATFQNYYQDLQNILYDETTPTLAPGSNNIADDPIFQSFDGGDKTKIQAIIAKLKNGTVSVDLVSGEVTGINDMGADLDFNDLSADLTNDEKTLLSRFAGTQSKVITGLNTNRLRLNLNAAITKIGDIKALVEDNDNDAPDVSDNPFLSSMPVFDPGDLSIDPPDLGNRTEYINILNSLEAELTTFRDSFIEKVLVSEDSFSLSKKTGGSAITITVPEINNFHFAGIDGRVNSEGNPIVVAANNDRESGSLAFFQKKIDDLEIAIAGQGNSPSGPEQAIRREYVTYVKHFQTLSGVLSGAYGTSAEYGISPGDGEFYSAKTEETLNLSTQLVKFNPGDNLSDEDNDNITSQFLEALNINENINAIQSVFDSQLTQQKQSAFASSASTSHFFLQVNNQIENDDDFIDGLDKLFETRQIKEFDSTLGDSGEYVFKPLQQFTSNNFSKGEYQYAGYMENQKFLDEDSGQGLKIPFHFPELFAVGGPFATGLPMWHDLDPSNSSYLTETKSYLEKLSNLRNEMATQASTEARREALEQFDLWLGNNSVSRVMVGALKDVSGVESDLNLIDSMINFQDSYIAKNGSASNQDIFNNFVTETEDQLNYISAQEDNTRSLSLKLDDFVSKINAASDYDSSVLNELFVDIKDLAEKPPFRRGIYKINGNFDRNLEFAEKLILPRLKAAEDASNTDTVKYYNALLESLLEGKSLPANFSSLPSTTVGEPSLIKPEDLILTNAEYEAIDFDAYVPVLPDTTKRDRFVNFSKADPEPGNMAEPYKTQLGVLEIIKKELLKVDGSGDLIVFGNPDKIHTETLYKSMIEGIISGNGIDPVDLNDQVNLAVGEWSGTDPATNVLKPHDIFTMVEAAEVNDAFQNSPSIALPSQPISNVTYTDAASIPGYSTGTFLSPNSLLDNLDDDMKRLDESINPRASRLKDLVDDSEVKTYSPTFALSDTVKDNSTEFKKDSIKGKTIQELLLILFVFQMFERSSWDFNKYVNDPNRYT
ncbi:MAG: hypothetical protein HRT47_08460 [Candidatus Caenarcaniphilales bacterium]|nr:hypothetical protein [Candidatus Caenarcaniphilales bacterium]